MTHARLADRCGFCGGLHFSYRMAELCHTKHARSIAARIVAEAVDDEVLEFERRLYERGSAPSVERLHQLVRF